MSMTLLSRQAKPRTIYLGVSVPASGLEPQYASIGAFKEALNRFARSRRPPSPLNATELAWLCSAIRARHPYPQIADSITGARLCLSSFGDPGIEMTCRGCVTFRLNISRLCNVGTPRARFNAAVRFAISEQMRAIRVNYFKDEPIKPCPVSHLPMTLELSDVDHAPPWTFANIVDDCLRSMEVGLDCARLDVARMFTMSPYDGDMFDEANFAAVIQQRHDELAQPRVIHRLVNRWLLPAMARESEEAPDDVPYDPYNDGDGAD